MRHFQKGAEPDDFRQWKASGNAAWTPTYGDLANPSKANLHQALLVEQHHCCCYCGRPVKRDDTHIEHFRPQAHPYAQLALEYNNLHASCNGRPAEIHCGHAKGDWFDEAMAISPLDTECEMRFRYAWNGEIEGCDAAAQAMIEHLKLNARVLNDDRASALLNVFDPDFIETATDQELAQFREIYTNADGSPSVPFAHVLIRYAEQLL